MPKIHLTKEYERDISLIVEALWARRLTTSLFERLEIESPYRPFIIFYVTSDNLQIWENAQALSWFKDQLLIENRKSVMFMEKIIAEHKKISAAMEFFWQAGPTNDKDTLKRYVILLGNAVSIFSLWYYSLIDERTPEKIRKLLIDLRSTDESFAKNDDFLKSCIAALGQNRTMANFILPEDFPDLPDEDTLKDRRRGIVSVDGMTNYYTTLEQFSATHPEYVFDGLGDSVKNLKEIKGQVAFSGRVTGLARIVKNEQQMTNLVVGEILLSPMTTPNFLPAMKKAGAIVTDEGGITCHAAIVARELKKPCIIGTKIATQVFKDGDLVEVDANKGIVKILKKT
jgi:phosphohistidine swiveling domain-containing protein